MDNETTWVMSLMTNGASLQPENKASKELHGCHASLSQLVFLILFASTTLFTAGPAMATRVSSQSLARAPQVEQSELEARAKAIGVPTFAEFLAANRPFPSNSKRLEENLRRAQHAWLNDSIDSARELFRQLTLQALEDDWREKERAVIQYAFLRLAQSAKSDSEKLEWLDRGARTFPNLSPDRTLFPPPLLLEFESAVKKANEDSIEIALDAIFPLHRFVLINGKRIDLRLQKRLRIPNGNVRVTALSDSVELTTEKMPASQLGNYRPSLSPLFSGTCTQPLLADEKLPDIDEVHVLFEDACIRKRLRREWASLPATGSQSIFARTSFEKMAGDRSSDSSGMPQSMLLLDGKFTHEARSPRRTWFWVAAVTLAAGSAYAWHHQHLREKERAPILPVHRTGF